MSRGRQGWAGIESVQDNSVPVYLEVNCLVEEKNSLGIPKEEQKAELDTTFIVITVRLQRWCVAGNNFQILQN